VFRFSASATVSHAFVQSVIDPSCIWSPALSSVLTTSWSSVDASSVTFQCSQPATVPAIAVRFRSRLRRLSILQLLHIVSHASVQSVTDPSYSWSPALSSAFTTPWSSVDALLATFQCSQSATVPATAVRFQSRLAVRPHFRCCISSATLQCSQSASVPATAVRFRSRLAVRPYFRCCISSATPQCSQPPTVLASTSCYLKMAETVMSRLYSRCMSVTFQCSVPSTRPQ